MASMSSVARGALVPRQVGDPLEVGADHAELGVGVVHRLEAGELAVGDLAGLLGQARRCRAARAGPAGRRTWAPRRAPSGSRAAAGAAGPRAGCCGGRERTSESILCLSSARVMASSSRRETRRRRSLTSRARWRTWYLLVGRVEAERRGHAVAPAGRESSPRTEELDPLTSSVQACRARSPAASRACASRERRRTASPAGSGRLVGSCSTSAVQ